MKHLTYAVALAILGTLAFTSTASAVTASAVTTETGGEVATPTIQMASEGGHISLANAIATIECSSAVEWKVESHGEGVPVTGNISDLEFTGCTNGWTVEVSAAGSLSVTWTSGHNGTLISSGTTLTAVRHTIFGTFTCRYLTNNTHIGTVTGGNPATLHVEATIPFHSGDGLCGKEPSAWTGDYVTESALFVGAIGMEVDPPQKVVFAKVGDEQKVKIKNSGTLPYNSLTVTLTGKKIGFELKKTCDGIALAAGNTCEETIKCLKANVPEGFSAVGKNVSLIQAIIFLEC